jgi:hypothetical protein
MKLPLKLLILITLFATVAVPVGWKWASKPKTTKALAYAIAPIDATTPVDAIAPADATAPDDATAPADATAVDPSASLDPSLAPADTDSPDPVTSSGTSVNPDGWTWDTGE